MSISSSSSISLLFIFLTLPFSSYAQAPFEQVTLPPGTVFRVALTARTPMEHVGRPVEVTLTEPVYLYDRLVISANTTILGRITALDPVPRGERIIALSKGDFTPLHDPVLQFDRLILQGTEIQIKTEAVRRNTQLVNLRDPESKGRSLVSKMGKKLQEKTGGVPGGPTRMGLIKNYLLSSLPYHPQVLDRGSPFDAVLQEPVALSIPAQEPVDLSHMGEALPAGTLAQARLITDLSSASSSEGMPVEAVLAKPIYGSNHELLYPEGAELFGRVIRVRSAGWFSKRGELRFGFDSLRLPAADEQRIGALETQRRLNVTIDAEGGTEAHLGGRFAAPIFDMLTGGVAISHRHDRIKSTITSNGLRVIGRIAGIAGPASVSTGLSYYGYARSIYLCLIRKGPEAQFPANTRLEIRLTPPSGTPLKVR